MRAIRVIVGGGLIAALLMGAAMVQAALPPLIDREVIFGDPEISGAQLSPDGKFITFMKPFKGTRNIWIKSTQEPFDKARPLTADTKRPIPQYFWSRDGKYVLFVQDNGGDENFNVYAVSPEQTPAAGKDVPDARNLTDLKGVRVAIYSLPKIDPDVMYIGLNDRDAAWHDLYKMRISTGERTLLRQNTEKIAGWDFDLSGQLRLAARVADNGDTEVLRVDADRFTKIYSCSVFESCGAARFSKDGKQVYFLSNKGDANFTTLSLMDPSTGALQPVETDPEKRVDFGNALFSEVTDELIATVYVDDRARVYWRDKAFEADYKFLKQKLGDKELGIASRTRDERLLLIGANADTEPGEVYLFDRDKKQLTLQYKIRERLPRASLAKMKPIHYASSDGLDIPAYLTLPQGVSHKSLPLIVVPHGGPWSRDAWGYSGLAQFYANRGFAVLQVNFRGSTGYGKKFLNAGNGEWGDKMQDDITWGVKHLVKQGIADAKRVAIMGGSYGGYATLAGVAFTPDLYAAGVSFVGPSNIITLLDSIPAYWEAGRKQLYARIADPNTPEGKAKLQRQSPLNSVDKIKTPLLVLQGANDPRVKRRESDQIVIALRDKNFPVQYIVAPDEGHGFARPVNNMAAYAETEKFLAKHIKGVRYQPDMTPEVAQRLKEITVDPKSLELPKASNTANAPIPSIAIATGVSQYKTTMEAGGQKMELKTTTEVKDTGTAISITESTKTPMGDAVDVGTYDKKSLQLLNRSVTQGPLSIRYKIDAGKAQGEMKMNDQARPINVDLGGATFGDGPGVGSILATLPLADGYSASSKTLNLRTMQTNTTQLRVVGRESVTVPAGTFDTVKAEIDTGDGGKVTVWIANSPRKMVKSVTSGPQTGGGAITTELE
jgi:dipeptidyl aminopeptidase/acylaminoacyl peptidase